MLHHMLATLTKSKVSTKTQVKIATAILLLGAGAAAFAAFGLPTKLYSTLSVSCQDGSRMSEDQYIQTVYRTTTSSPQVAPGVPCFTNKEAQAIAAAFCQETRNPITGKTGINTLSISGKCEQPPEKAPYGYGYGYPTNKK